MQTTMSDTLAKKEAISRARSLAAQQAASAPLPTKGPTLQLTTPHQATSKALSHPPAKAFTSSLPSME